MQYYRCFQRIGLGGNPLDLGKKIPRFLVTLSWVSGITGMVNFWAKTAPMLNITHPTSRKACS